MNKIAYSALMAMGIAFTAHAQEQIEQASPSPSSESSTTHSAALHKGKHSTDGHAAIHRDGMALEDRPAISVVVLWQDKYVSEGRDNLERGGLYSIEGVVEWNGFSAGAWFAAGDTESYEEVNLMIESAKTIGLLDLSLGYTRLEFLEDHTDDNEFAAGVALNNIPYVVPVVDYIYSTEAEGGFLEVSLESEMAFFKERLILQPYATQSFDFGYATASHDGPNNIQVGIGFSLALMNDLDLVGAVSHSWAQADVEREGLGDLSWAVVGLAATF